MRKAKTFKIEGYDDSFEVKELTVKEIISLIQEDVLGDASVEALKTLFSDRLLPLCTNVTLKDLMEMAPSEIVTIWDHFCEVNSAFFDVARKTGLQSAAEDFKKAITADFTKLLVNSSKQDTPTS